MLIRSRFRWSCVTFVMAAVACAVCVAPASAVDYFADDFDSYSDDAAVTAAGFQLFEQNATEVGTLWTITNPGERDNPPTIDGTATTGNFMIADTDAGSGSDFAGSMAKYNMVTPSFSTVGGGNPWLHVDASIQQNNNSLNVFFIDVSVDGGTTWDTRYMQVGPGRGSANFDPSPEPRIFQPDNTNSGGYFGRLDVDLGEGAANQADVRVKFQMYEPNDDWWYAVDNVKVDDVAKVSTGETTAFFEDFNTQTPGQMGVITVVDDPNGLSGWVTKDNGIDSGNAQYFPGQVGDLDGRSVARIGHPDPVGPNGEVSFAITEGGLATDTDPPGVYHTILHTPVLDLSDVSDVVLEYEDEGYPADEFARVLLMQDEDGNGPDADDTVLRVIFDYLGGGMFWQGEEDPFYAARAFSVPEADGLANVYFAWESGSAGVVDERFGAWWAIDTVSVSGTTGGGELGDVNLDGVVNGLDVDPFVDVLLNGPFQNEADMNQDGVVNGLDVDPFVAAVVGGGAQAVPEPSTLGLFVLGGILPWLLVSRRRRK